MTPRAHRGGFVNEAVLDCRASGVAGRLSRRFDWRDHDRKTRSEA
jgi:hypothetical protein